MKPRDMLIVLDARHQATGAEESIYSAAACIRQLNAAVGGGETGIRYLEQENEALRTLTRRALSIITDAILHGMPITEEVAAVRNEIVLWGKQ